MNWYLKFNVHLSLSISMNMVNIYPSLPCIDTCLISNHDSIYYQHYSFMNSKWSLMWDWIIIYFVVITFTLALWILCNVLPLSTLYNLICIHVRLCYYYHIYILPIMYWWMFIYTSTSSTDLIISTKLWFSMSSYCTLAKAISWKW